MLQSILVGTLMGWVIYTLIRMFLHNKKKWKTIDEYEEEYNKIRKERENVKQDSGNGW